MLENRGIKYKKLDILGKYMFKLIKNVVFVFILVK